MESKLLIDVDTLPILDLDHPGAHDLAYRRRREMIVRNVISFHQNKFSEREIPLVEYTAEEHAVWKKVSRKLHLLQEKWAYSMYKEGRRKLIISDASIPQLADLHEQLQQLSGFSLEPIHGLVAPRQFLAKLADNIMLCTQYIRHHSKPEFTPEPDIIHEVLGHVPFFVDDRFMALQQKIGKAALQVTDEELEQLSRLYWFTIEYGLIKEGNGIKALGAGLLGGIQDLTNAFTGRVDIRPFDLQEVIHTDYNYSFEQPIFFILESWEQLEKETEKLIGSFRRS